MDNVDGYLELYAPSYAESWESRDVNQDSPKDMSDSLLYESVSEDLSMDVNVGESCGIVSEVDTPAELSYDVISQTSYHSLQADISYDIISDASYQSAREDLSYDMVSDEISYESITTGATPYEEINQTADSDDTIDERVRLVEHSSPQDDGAAKPKFGEGTGKSYCPICKVRTTRARRHAQCYHLPWFCEPSQSCWECKRYFSTPNKLQEHFSEHPAGRFTLARIPAYCLSMLSLVCQLGYTAFKLRDPMLIAKRIQERIHQINRFSSTRPVTLHLERLFLCMAGLEDLYRTPLGALVGSLLHWRVLIHLIQYSPAKDQQAIRGTVLEQPTLNQALTVHEPPARLVDAHWHWDRASSSRPFPASLTEYMLATKPSRTSWRFRGLVANYAFPESWPTTHEWVTLTRMDSRMIATIGVHPKSARYGWTARMERTITKALENGLVCAIGECGMDESTPQARATLPEQRDVLRQQLRLANRFRKPVVIHARGGEALQATVREIMQDSLAQNHLLHIHCFMGSTADVDRWIAAFPAVTFGFTALVLSGKIDSTIRSLALDKILLESDAPFLAPPDAPRPNNPWIVNRIADHIAAIKNVPLPVVGRVTSWTAAGVYGQQDAWW